MALPVFISYSRASSRDFAVVLQRELGPDVVFRDELSIEPGTLFPEETFRAEIGASVVVLFLDEQYHSSPFCDAELQIALAPYAEEGQERPEYLDHIVVVLPLAGQAVALQSLPPALQSIHWPLVDEPERIAKLVRDRLVARAGKRLGDALREATTRSLSQRFQAIAAMPPRQEPAPACLMVSIPPMPMGGFYGRGRLMAQVYRRLLPGRTSGAAALIGAGGAGKTRAAMEFVWRFGLSYFPGGLIWINAADPGTRATQLHRVVKRLAQIQNREVASLDALLGANVDLIGLLRETLEELPNSLPMLWVVDDIQEPAPSQPIQALAEWAPLGARRLSILATSRHRLHPDELNLNMGGLDREDAARFLCDAAPGHITAQEALEIAAAVHDWPLALDMLSQAFSSSGLTPRRFARLLEQSGTLGALEKTEAGLRNSVPVDALRGISATFVLSYEKLPLAAQSLACALAQLGTAPIPDSLLDELPEDIGSIEACATIKRRSFLGEGDRNSLGTIHPLLGEFLRAQQRAAEGLFLAGQALLGAVESIEPMTPSLWDAAEAFAVHVGPLLRRPGLPEEIALPLAAWLGGLRFSLGMYQEAAVIQEARAVQATQLWGIFDSRSLDATMDYAETLLALGRLPEATDRLEAVLDLMTEELADAGSLRLRCLLLLGNVMWRLGRYARAEELQSQAVEGYAGSGGADNLDVLRALHHLAITKWSNSKLDEAQEMNERLLRLRTHQLGPTHQDTLKSMQNLALVLRQQGDLVRAFDLIRKSSEGCAATLGKLHPETLKTRHNLALLHRQQQEFERARELLEELIPLRKAVLGGDHPDTLGSRMNLAMNLWSLKRTSEAVEHFGHVYEDQCRVLGPEHPETLRTLSNWGMALFDLGQPDEARAHLHRALEAKIRVLGASHQETKNVKEALEEMDEN